MAEAGWVSRALLSSAFLGAMVAALTWPIASIAPATGPDPSWMAGLYMAHGEGLQFGRDIVFTYGPLGFLEVPILYDEAMWALAFLYQAAVHVALAASLIWAGRRAFPLPIAVVLCYCLLAIGRIEGAVVLLALVWCLAALGDRPLGLSLPLVIGGGVLAAVELLGKANYGVAILILATLTAVSLPDRRRNLPLFAGAATGAFAVAWFAGGQSLDVLPEFAERSAQVISGYSSAMGTDILVVDWQLPAAIAAVALLLLVTALATGKWPAPRRLVAIALVAVFSFFAFKQGFVRQGLGNTPEFFVLIAGAAIAAASLEPRATGRSVALAVLTAPLVTIALLASPASSLWTSLKPQLHLEYLRASVDALVLPRERERLISEARASMRFAYDVDSGILSALGDRPVHIDPWEIGVAWAYGLNWQPLPAMQTYLAYTPELDDMNAAALAGPGGPAAILRHRTADPGSGTTASLDGRYPGWESPEAMREMLCRYRVVRTTPRWQLLVRAADRCGAPRSIGVVYSTTGSPIPVPQASPGSLVFARLHGIGVGGWESVRATLYRARERTVEIAGRGKWKLLPSTAGDGLLLRVPRPADFPERFRLAPDPQTISLRIAGAASRAVKVEFFAQPIHRFPGAGGHPGWRGSTVKPEPARGR